MRILLVGEYSRLHNTLKEGLLALGHETTLVGTGDGFKNYPVDIRINSTLQSIALFRFLSRVCDKFIGINLIQLEHASRFRSILPQLKGYDIVQLINETSLRTTIDKEIELLKRLFVQNKSQFLLSCGIDHISVKFAYNKKFKYSIFTPLHKDNSLKEHYQFMLKKLSQEHLKLHTFLMDNIEGVISSDLDYHIPFLGERKYLGLIPNPVNTDEIKYIPNTNLEKIIIFHGVNTQNYIKKGNVFFDEALHIIKSKYASKVEIIRVENMSYKTYINLYNSCHIFLDQVYAYDQGYNALEAMAKGKVVFTGAEQEWLEYYNLKEDNVAINALPNAKLIADKLEWLIENPDEIETISKAARNFIETNHNYKEVAKQYLSKWTQNVSNSE